MSTSTPLSERLRAMYNEMAKNAPEQRGIEGWDTNLYWEAIRAIEALEAREPKAPISWRDIKVTKGQETHTLGTLIELLEYERDTALASLKSQEAKAIGEQTPVVIKDSEVFTACETYADNYMIEGRITTSPKAMRKALENFLKYRK